jgi:pyruvyl transferase EpsI
LIAAINPSINYGLPWHIESVLNSKEFMKGMSKIYNKLLKKIHLNEIIDLHKGEIHKNDFSSFIGKKKIFFFLIPDYGNIGDQAIAVATFRYIEDYFNDYEIVKIELQDTFLFMKAAIKAYEEGDLIVLQGGGNMGNLYPDIERYRKFVIKYFKQSKIISFPTTVSYTDDSRGRKCLLRDVLIYSECKDLTLIAREKFSYDIMKSNFKSNKVILNPDIVLFYSKYIKPSEYLRHDILICIRHDFESKLSNENREELMYFLDDNFNGYLLYETQQAHKINEYMRVREVSSALEVFKHSKLVITDRLHGMIFAAITGAPCIAISSRDHKIKGTYEWIKNLEYIKLIDPFEIEEIKSEIHSLLAMDITAKINVSKFENLRDQLIAEKF